MKINLLFVYCSLLISGLCFQEVKAETALPRISELESHHTEARLLVQTPTIVITGVQLNPTETGLEIILETTDEGALQPLIYSQDDNLIIEILDAVLQLPEAEVFRAENPTPEITSVTVERVDTNSIRITVAGKTGIPGAEVIPSEQNLVLGITPDATITKTPEEEIEIVATGEQPEGYYVPEATTSTKTDTRIFDVPASIQVIPREVIRDQGAVSVREALRNISGVTLSSTSGGRDERFIVRGFEAEQFTNGFRDDFFSTRTQKDLANIERIEVLKGPASVLFGRAEPAGIINFITKQPLLEPYYQISFTAGNYSFYRPTIDLSGPLNQSKTLAYRLNIAYENAESFRDGVETERIFVAPTLQWQISQDTQLRLEFTYLHDQRPIDRGLVVLSDNQIADIPISRFLGDPRQMQFDETSLTLYLNHNFTENIALKSAFRYTYAFEGGPGATTQIIGSSEDDRNYPLTDFSGRQDYETWSFQNDLIAKFRTGPVEHVGLVGIEFSRQYSYFGFQSRSAGTIDIFNPDYNFTFGEFSPFEDGENQITTFGIYLQDQISLLSNLKLVVGGRFDTFTDDGDFAGESFSTNADAFSPRVGLVYQPIPQVALYTSYTQSFTPVSGRSVNDEAFDPQKGTGYEIGVKTELLQGRLFSTLAFYRTNLDNILTDDPNNPGFSIQVGEQRSQGIELDVTGEILPGWNIIASYGYTDATIVKDNFFAEGNRLNNVPRNTVSFWTTYTLQKGSLAGLGFGAGIFYVDERAGDLNNSFVVPSYTRVDLALYYQREQLRAALNFKNVFDERYFEGSQNRNTVQPGAPFTVLGTVSWDF